MDDAGFSVRGSYVWVCAFCGNATMSAVPGEPNYCRGERTRRPHAPYRMAWCVAAREPRDDTSEQVDPRLRASLGLSDMTTVKEIAR